MNDHDNQMLQQPNLGSFHGLIWSQRPNVNLTWPLQLHLDSMASIGLKTLNNLTTTSIASLNLSDLTTALTVSFSFSNLTLASVALFGLVNPTFASLASLMSQTTLFRPSASLWSQRPNLKSRRSNLRLYGFTTLTLASKASPWLRRPRNYVRCSILYNMLFLL